MIISSSDYDLDAVINNQGAVIETESMLPAEWSMVRNDNHHSSFSACEDPDVSSVSSSSSSSSSSLSSNTSRDSSLSSLDADCSASRLDILLRQALEQTAPGIIQTGTTTNTFQLAYARAGDWDLHTIHETAEEKDSLSAESQTAEAVIDAINKQRDSGDIEETSDQGKAEEDAHFAEVENISAFYHQYVTSSVPSGTLRRRGRVHIARRLFQECLPKRALIVQALIDEAAPSEPNVEGVHNPEFNPELKAKFKSEVEPESQSKKGDLINLFNSNYFLSDASDSQENVFQVNRAMIKSDISKVYVDGSSKDSLGGDPCSCVCSATQHAWPFSAWQPMACKTCNRSHCECEHPGEATHQLEAHEATTELGETYV